MGFVETELTIMRSVDKGRTWNVPQTFEPPLTGPSFEMCCPIRILSDGRWIIPTSTWRSFDGYCPNGMKAVRLQDGSIFVVIWAVEDCVANIRWLKLGINHTI